MKCFYHSADLDGHCSGAIVKMAFPKCELIGINYGDKFPWEDIRIEETVFMVDFSLQPFGDMLRLAQQCELIWIDHHKSAIEEAHKVGFLARQQILEDGIGACALVWDHCFPGQDRPKFVKLLAEYDVWNHTNTWTLPFQWGMRLKVTLPDKSPGLWDSLQRIENVVRIVDEGNIVLQYVAQDNRKYLDACGFDTELDGLRCIAINRMLTNSQMFDSAWDPKKYDAMLTFGFRKGQWTVSLYSTKDDVDVSVIAKNRGGGGHKGAAGFQCDQLPFMLPTKDGVFK